MIRIPDYPLAYWIAIFILVILFFLGMVLDYKRDTIRYKDAKRINNKAKSKKHDTRNT